MGLMQILATFSVIEAWYNIVALTGRDQPRMVRENALEAPFTIDPYRSQAYIKSIIDDPTEDPEIKAMFSRTTLP